MRFNYPKNVCFKCLKCALCCGDTKNRVRTILLLKIEAERISKKTLLSVNDFAERIEGFEPYIFKMKKTDEGKCMFLNNNVCSIYPLRPLICRFYPFQFKDMGNNRHSFIHTEECPGIGKGPRLRKEFFERLFTNLMKSMNENAGVA